MTTALLAIAVAVLPWVAIAAVIWWPDREARDE